MVDSNLAMKQSTVAYQPFTKQLFSLGCGTVLHKVTMFSVLLLIPERMVSELFFP
jgi:hypothetical protein